MAIIICSMPGGQEKFVGIVDLQGWGYSNCDIRGYIAALDIMQVGLRIAAMQLLLLALKSISALTFFSYERFPENYVYDPDLFV